MGINPIPFIFLDDHNLIHGFSDGYSDRADMLGFRSNHVLLKLTKLPPRI